MSGDCNVPVGGNETSGAVVVKCEVEVKVEAQCEDQVEVKVEVKVESLDAHESAVVEAQFASTFVGTYSLLPSDVQTEPLDYSTKATQGSSVELEPASPDTSDKTENPPQIESHESNLCNSNAVDSKTHKRTHRPTNRQCPECDSNFRLQRELNKHIKTAHRRDEVFQCSVCGKRFPRKRLLGQHLWYYRKMSTHEPQPKKRCSQCDSVFTEKRELVKHLKSTHNIKEYYQCNACDKRFPSRNKLVGHLRYHGDKPHGKETKPRAAPKCHQCRHCPRSFSIRLDLDSHFRTTHRNELFQCDACAKQFFNRRTLVDHLRHHCGKGRRSRPTPTLHRCLQCDSDFPLKRDLDKHLRSHNGPVTCDACGKQFARKQQLVKHMRYHRVKSYACDICKKVFSDSYAIRRHGKSHTGERAHACAFCPKKYASLADLRRHELSHGGRAPEMPLVCDHCGKRFLFRWHLANHVRTHTGERPFKCDICPKSFARKTNLDTHRPIHSADKPFACADCGKRFAMKFYLARHLKLHRPVAAVKVRKTLGKNGRARRP